jgi:uncharacterized protein (TIGR02001 family)
MTSIHSSALFSRSARLRVAGAATSLLLMCGSAFAADLATKKMPEPVAPPPSVPFDLAFGAKISSDYNFRGISQSNRKPSLSGYVEAQFFDNLIYAGIAGYSVDLVTKPDAEIDFTAGIRPKFGPFTLDLGVIGYYYPGERRYIDTVGTIWSPKNTDFTEIAAKLSYNFEDKLTLGANVFYAWNWLGTGAEATYVSGTAKYSLPFLDGLAVSGEFGRYMIGTTSPQLGSIRLPDYNYWNAGVSYTYKVVTLDLRYHDTNLSKTECFALSGDPSGIVSGSGRSKWCNSTFIASLGFDTTLNTLGVLPVAK